MSLFYNRPTAFHLLTKFVLLVLHCAFVDASREGADLTTPTEAAHIIRPLWRRIFIALLDYCRYYQSPKLTVRLKLFSLHNYAFRTNTRRNRCVPTGNWYFVVEFNFLHSPSTPSAANNANNGCRQWPRLRDYRHIRFENDRYECTSQIGSLSRPADPQLDWNVELCCCFELRKYHQADW